jgi:hypothetical protein
MFLMREPLILPRSWRAGEPRRGALAALSALAVGENAALPLR